jgi:hypothetical protein
MADSNQRVRNARIVQWIAEVHSLTKNKPADWHHIMSETDTEISNGFLGPFGVSKALNPAAPLFVPRDILNPTAPEYVPRLRDQEQEPVTTDTTTTESVTIHAIQDIPEWRRQPEIGYQYQYYRGHGRGRKRKDRMRIYADQTAPAAFVIPAIQFPGFKATLDYGSTFPGHVGHQYIPRSASVSPRTILPNLPCAQPLFGTCPQVNTVGRMQYSTQEPLVDQNHVRPFPVHDPDTNCFPQWATLSEVVDNTLAGPGPAIGMSTETFASSSSAPTTRGILQAEHDLYKLTAYPIDRALLRMHVTNLGIDMRRDHTSRGLRNWGGMPEFDLGYSQRVLQFDTMPAPELEEVIRKVSEK